MSQKSPHHEVGREVEQITRPFQEMRPLARECQHRTSNRPHPCHSFDVEIDAGKFVGVVSKKPASLHDQRPFQPLGGGEQSQLRQVPQHPHKQTWALYRQREGGLEDFANPHHKRKPLYPVDRDPNAFNVRFHGTFDQCTKQGVFSRKYW